MSAVLGEGADAEVVSVERTSRDWMVGLQLVWVEVLEKISTLPDQGRAPHTSVQLLGWADLVSSRGDPTTGLTTQRLMDSARRRQLPADDLNEPQEGANRE